MTIFLIVLSIVFWAAALFLLINKQLLAPAASYLGLLTLSFARDGEYPLVPLNNTIIVGWLCMTLVVMVATILQPVGVQQQNRGMGYITGGALVGMAVGLLGYTMTTDVTMLYGIMILATAVGTFMGFLFFTNTPQGADVNLRSGYFVRYLTAKGFPAAITVMMIGIVLVILIAQHQISA